MSTPVKTLIGKFVWHENYSDDVEGSKEFYADVFGWDYEVWKPGEADYSMVKVGDAMHAGFLAAQGGAPAHWLGIVQVDDCDAVAKRAEASGGKVHAGPMDIPDVGRMAVIGDPQGAVLAAMAAQSETQDMPPAEGVFVWDELATSDVEGAKGFYAELFGWATEDMDMGPGGTYTMFRRAGDEQAGGAMPLPEGVPHPYWMTYIATDDVDACSERVTSSGGTIVMEPMDVMSVGRLSVARDPQGAVFGIFKPSEG